MRIAVAQDLLSRFELRAVLDLIGSREAHDNAGDDGGGTGRQRAEGHVQAGDGSASAHPVVDAESVGEVG